MTITLGQLITWLIIGALAGSLAGALVRRRRRGYGLAVNLAIGLVGALLGGVIFRLLNVNLGLGQIVLSGEDLVAAFLGALLFLAILSAFRRR